MNRLLFIMLMFSSWIAEAKEIFPVGCIPLAVHGEIATLSADKPLVVMMHNLSKTVLWITHPVNNPSAQAGWSSQLDPGKWSALALDHQAAPFKLSCIESKPGHEQHIACSTALAVCQWPHASMPDDKSGTFWAGENMDMLPLKAYIERLGFVLNVVNRE